MKNITITISKPEVEKLKQLISNFNSYYETEKEWNFSDIDNQREIAVEMVKILENKIYAN